MFVGKLKIICQVLQNEVYKNAKGYIVLKTRSLDMITTRDI